MANPSPSFSKAGLREPGYSLQNALSLAEASMLVYESRVDVLDATLGNWGLERRLAFDQEETQGFVAQDEDIMIVAFRGTEANIRDWIRNLKIIQVASIMGKVHRGFKQGLDAVWEKDLEPILREASKSKRAIWFTGHSLGAALATLAAERSHAWLPLTGVYTFGQPLVGNREFQTQFDETFVGRFFRFVNHRDLVTKIPPAPLYTHVSTLTKLDAEGDIVASRGFGEDDPDEQPFTEEEFEELLEELDPDSQSRGFVTRAMGIDDHNMVEGYIRKLTRLCDSSQT